MQICPLTGSTKCQYTTGHERTRPPPPTPPPDSATRCAPCNPCIAHATTASSQPVDCRTSESRAHTPYSASAASRWTRAPAAGRCRRSKSCQTAGQAGIRTVRRGLARSRLKYKSQQLPALNLQPATDNCSQKSTCMRTTPPAPGRGPGCSRGGQCTGASSA